MQAAGESPGSVARRLLRRVDRAALATAQRDADGWPYASLVLVALDHEAGPILLISDLADHTGNIARDDRVALLFDGTAGLNEPLAGARVTLLGRAVRSDAAQLRARYLARHPSARAYADFKDFHLFRVAVRRAHLVAGFGRVHWLEADALLLRGAGAAPLVAEEAGVVAHLNADHADTIALYANALLGRPGDGWRLTGCDPEGVDLRRGGEVARLDFDEPVSAAAGARAALVRLAERARRSAAE
jgi:putative heme iron utilization protein